MMMTISMILMFFEIIFSPGLRNESGTGSDAALAVKSIPAYVEVADLFIALVPVTSTEREVNKLYICIVLNPVNPY